MWTAKFKMVKRVRVRRVGKVLAGARNSNVIVGSIPTPVVPTFNQPTTLNITTT